MGSFLRFKCTNSNFRMGLRPDPAGGAYSTPRSPSSRKWGLSGRRKGKNLKERERKNNGESGRLRGKEWGGRKVAANSNFSLKAIGGWVSCLGQMDTPASGRLLFVIQY